MVIFRVYYLDGLVLQPEPVERLYGLVGVVGAVVVDEAVAKALAGDLVPDELAGLHLADGGEEGSDLLLGHGLREVVDDQVGAGGVVGGLGGAAAGADRGRRGRRGRRH